MNASSLSFTFVSRRSLLVSSSLRGAQEKTTTLNQTAPPVVVLIPHLNDSPAPLLLFVQVRGALLQLGFAVRKQLRDLQREHDHMFTPLQDVSE